MFSFGVIVHACGPFPGSPSPSPAFRSFPGIQLLRLASFVSVVGVRGRAVGVCGRNFIGDAGREAGREGGRDGGRLLGGRLLDLLSKGLPLLGGLLSSGLPLLTGLLPSSEPPGD